MEGGRATSIGVSLSAERYGRIQALHPRLDGFFIGDTGMAIFSCPACGSHAFRLTADLKQAQCERCKTSLGSWQELRTRIQQHLRPSQPHQFAAVECSGMTLH